MDQPSPSLDLERALRVLRRRWPLILLCVVLVAASAFGFSEQQTRQYTASAALLFRNPALDQQASGLTPVSNADPQMDTATNIELVKLGDVGRRAAQVLGHGLTAKQVNAAVSVSPQGQTNVASVTATWTDPGLAAAIANTYTRQFISARQQIDRGNLQKALSLVDKQLAALSPQQRAGTQGQALADRAESLRILTSLQTGNAEFAQSATSPSSPSSPKVTRNTVLGAVVGLLLGLGLAFLLERLDRRLKESSDLEDVFGLPLLATVPESGAYARLASRSDGDRAGALPVAGIEVFRMLRARLRYFNVDRDVRSVLVTSAASGDGKTTVVENLAEAAATMGSRVLIIEADLRKPALAQRLGLRAAPGLAATLISPVPAEELPRVVQEVHLDAPENGPRAPEPISVLVAGPQPPNPAELIESHAMENVLAWATEHYDLVLLDTPPLSVVSDAIPLLRKVNGVMIVSRLGKNTREGAARMREELTSLGAPVLGIVANASRERDVPEYQYDYDYESPAYSPAASARD